MSKDFSIGNMNQRVTIKIVDKDKDASAGHDEDYATLTTTWAAVDDKGESKTFTDGNMVVFNRKDFYMNWRSTFSVIDKDTIFEHNGMKYKFYSPGQFIDDIKQVVKYETVGV